MAFALGTVSGARKRQRAHKLLAERGLLRERCPWGEKCELRCEKDAPLRRMVKSVDGQPGFYYYSVFRRDVVKHELW